MSWIPCGPCLGCGEIVRPFVVYDSEGNEVVQQMASPCTNCVGRGGWEE